MEKQRINQVYADLEDKTVVITGANRGVGRSLSACFLRNNCRVVCVYRKTVPEFSDEELAAGEHEPVMLKADINDVDTIAGWAEEYTQAGNSLDVLINNAGLYIRKKLIDCDKEDWNETMDTNLRSMFLISQAFVRHMRKNSNGGVIINAGSFTATMGSAGYGLYSISKAAIAQMTRCMAAEWAPYNIRVNAFSPGIVKTRMTAPAIEENPSEVLGAISMNRLGTLEEIDNAVLFLASEVSSYITGQNLNINGGKFVVQNPHAAWEWNNEG